MVDPVGPVVIVPKVGIPFDSEKEAYEMYNANAGMVGFSIRKSDTRRREDKTIFQKHIVCNNQGHGENEPSKSTTRTGCKSRVQFSISREGFSTVQKVELEHNHTLASPTKHTS
jgi:zinc finger SWIM domain-containing protein 3